MQEIQMGELEAKFADIIWENEPIRAVTLASKSEEKLSWKTTTSYTVLKRLCDKGIFKKEKGIVTSLISREDYYSRKSSQFVEDTFQGSLPAFLAAFTKSKKLTGEEIEEIRKIIEEAGSHGGNS